MTHLFSVVPVVHGIELTKIAHIDSLVHKDRARIRDVGGTTFLNPSLEVEHEVPFLFLQRRHTVHSHLVLN